MRIGKVDHGDSAIPRSPEASPSGGLPKITEPDSEDPTR
jgi:hypothetical protein